MPFQGGGFPNGPSAPNAPQPFQPQHQPSFPSHPQPGYQPQPYQQSYPQPGYQPQPFQPQPSFNQPSYPGSFSSQPVLQEYTDDVYYPNGVKKYDSFHKHFFYENNNKAYGLHFFFKFLNNFKIYFLFLNRWFSSSRIL